VDQTSGTTPTEAAAQTRDDGPPADAVTDTPGFGSRGKARRRARFLRKARELAYRDLGGLVFNLHRFGQRNDALVLAKLNTLGQIDGELRTLESALHEREPVTILREAGITACARCAAIHSSEDRFCPNCGLSMARHVDLPIAGAPAPAPGQPAPAAPGQPAPAAPAQTTPATAATAASVPAAAGAAAPPASDAGRSPRPPDLTQTPAGAAAEPPVTRGGEEATEILRPGAPGT